MHSSIVAAREELSWIPLCITQSSYIIFDFLLIGLNGPIIDPQLSARYAHILVIDNPSSFPFDSYNISLVRKNASYQVCKDLGPPDKRFLVKPQGNITFTDLEENSAYTVKVVVYISHKYGAGFRSSIKDFTTLIAGMLLILPTMHLRHIIMLEFH